MTALHGSLGEESCTRKMGSDLWRSKRNERDASPTGPAGPASGEPGLTNSVKHCQWP